MERKEGTPAKELKEFLIRRFLLVMAGIYGCSELISLFYRFFMLPWLLNLSWFREIHITGERVSWKLLLQVMAILAADLLPEKLSGLPRSIVSHVVGGTVQIRVGELPVNGVLGSLLELSILLLVIAMLLVSLLPYAVGAFVYCRMVVKKINERIWQEKEQQREYERRRNLLISDIAHDIKTPITTICGYSRALCDGMTPKERQKEYLEAIYAKSMRMSELVTLLFEYVKLDSEGYVLRREDCDFTELVRELTAAVYTDFEEKKMEVQIVLPQTSLYCRIDRIQMGRVVMNLLENAVRYGKEGGKVLIRLKERELIVADDGEKIEPEFAEHIFEPFSRADKSRSTQGGSGLGLSIAEKVAQMHGGSLELDCDCKGGYTKAFRLHLPEE